mmetsp:Transcript_42551/g.83896  ORF Transcript_42551/g.83896 Transcript_42551/m.83896 type:complete len:99 (-) Transcript_42551:560-856(-)
MALLPPSGTGFAALNFDRYIPVCSHSGALFAGQSEGIFCIPGFEMHSGSLLIFFLPGGQVAVLSLFFLHGYCTRIRQSWVFELKPKRKDASSCQAPER